MAEPEDHRHCIVCGKVTSPDKFLCSPECEEMFERHQEQLKRRRTLTMVFFVVLFVFVILLALSGS